jgi:hypothetical protein
MKQQKEEGVGKDRTYEDGEFLNLHGEPHRIRLFPGSKDSVEKIDQVLLVTLKDKDGPKRRKKVLEQFLTKECEERMQQLSDIFVEMTDFIDEDDLEVDFIPEFASGAVMMEVQELRTVGDEVQKLKMILDKADNFTIVPLLDGGVRISFTVQNVFK